MGFCSHTSLPTYLPLLCSNCSCCAWQSQESWLWLFSLVGIVIIIISGSVAYLAFITYLTASRSCCVLAALACYLAAAAAVLTAVSYSYPPTATYSYCRLLLAAGSLLLLSLPSLPFTNRATLCVWELVCVRCVVWPECGLDIAIRWCFFSLFPFSIFPFTPRLSGTEYLISSLSLSPPCLEHLLACPWSDSACWEYLYLRLLADLRDRRYRGFLESPTSSLTNTSYFKKWTTAKARPPPHHTEFGVNKSP